MSLVHFEKTILPCVANDVTAWHVAHGWIWDVVETDSGRRIGVFFCTLLCGSGCVCHFDTVMRGIRPEIVLAAMRKGIRMIVPVCDVVYATIPEQKAGLIHCAIRFGFGIVDGGGFVSDGSAVVLLKYFGRGNTILNIGSKTFGKE